MVPLGLHDADGVPRDGEAVDVAVAAEHDLDRPRLRVEAPQHVAALVGRADVEVVAGRPPLGCVARVPQFEVAVEARREVRDLTDLSGEQFDLGLDERRVVGRRRRVRDAVVWPGRVHGQCRPPAPHDGDGLGFAVLGIVGLDLPAEFVVAAVPNRVVEVVAPRRPQAVDVAARDALDLPRVDVGGVDVRARAVGVRLVRPVDVAVDDPRVRVLALVLVGHFEVVAGLDFLRAHGLQEGDTLAVGPPRDTGHAAHDVRHLFGFAAVGRHDPQLGPLVTRASGRHERDAVSRGAPRWLGVYPLFDGEALRLAAVGRGDVDGRLVVGLGLGGALDVRHALPVRRHRRVGELRELEVVAGLDTIHARTQFRRAHRRLPPRTVPHYSTAARPLVALWMRSRRSAASSLATVTSKATSSP